MEAAGTAMVGARGAEVLVAVDTEAAVAEGARLVVGMTVAETAVGRVAVEGAMTEVA